MSLINAVKNIARRVYNNDRKVGDLGSLNTADKSSIVQAINELASRMAGQNNLSETRVQQIAAEELAKITNGASAAMDTLAEVEAALNNGSSQVAQLLVEIGAAKTKNEQLQSEINTLKTYTGSAESETLEAETTRLMNTGV